MACETCFSGFQWTPFNDGTGRCYRKVITPWTLPSNPIQLSAVTSTVYSCFGTRIYSTFNSNGAATGPTTNLTSIPLWNSSFNASQGPLNRCALWTTIPDNLPVNTWVGFTKCINLGSVPKTYYVGVAADNNFKISLDGNVIVDTLNGPYDNIAEAFNYWHVYPVFIPAGDHVIEIFGLNRRSIAGFGCEIYDNTLNQLIAATAYTDLNVIFTTSGVSQADTFQDLNGVYLSSGITCSQGGTVSFCDSGCTQYIICEPSNISQTPTPTITPTPTLTPTPTPTKLPTSQYLKDCCDNKIYKSFSNTNYLLGQVVRLLPKNFCYTVVSEPKIPPTNSVNDSLGYEYENSCASRKCQPCQVGSGSTKNSCDVLTILDFFFECNTTDPSSYNSFDGILSVNISGGTPPYKVTWIDENGNVYHGKTIHNATSGTYTVQVVDYWGDFSGETTCTIQGPKDCSFNGSMFEYIKSVDKFSWSGQPECQKDSYFSIRKVISGVSSPSSVYYVDDTSSPLFGRVYVADADNRVKGNVYWFDPVTATTEAHMNYYTGFSLNNNTRLRYSSLYDNFIDEQYKRILFVGTDSTDCSQVNVTSNVTGLVSYDMLTDTHTVPVVYGSNLAYNRTLLFVTPSYIYLNISNSSNPYTTDIIRVDRSNFGGLMNIPVTGTTDLLRYMKSSPLLTSIGNYIWMINTGGGGSTPNASGATGGRIGIFTNNFTYQGEIILPNVQTYDTGYANCCFYWQNLFFDPVSNLIFATDAGSNQRFVIQPNSTYSGGTIVYVESLEDRLQGKTNAFLNWTIDPVSNELYENWLLINEQKTDTNYLFKSYNVDRSSPTYSYKRMLVNTNIGKLKRVNDGLSTSIMGVNSGTLWWGCGPNYNTDGTITFYNNNVGSENNGYYNINTLYEINNTTGLPTGITKPNLPSDPDYKTTPVLDTSICPIIFTTGCPETLLSKSATSLTFELNFSSSTVLNPNITNITVSAVNLSTGLVEGVPQSYIFPYPRNYIKGQFTGLNGLANYSARTEFFNGMTSLKTC